MLLKEKLKEMAILINEMDALLEINKQLIRIADALEILAIEERKRKL